jgi:hypothetical protein
MDLKSGVYRVRRAEEIIDRVRGSALAVAKIRYAEKDLLLKRMAAALDFPQWFGENWDALEDCLSDLSWRNAAGHVLIFEGAKAGDDFGVLTDILRSSAEYWTGRGTPFLAVFVDPAGALALPDLK